MGSRAFGFRVRLDKVSEVRDFQNACHRNMGFAFPHSLVTTSKMRACAQVPCERPQ